MTKFIWGGFYFNIQFHAFQARLLSDVKLISHGLVVAALRSRAIVQAPLEKMVPVPRAKTGHQPWDTFT
jgi:hypothetical protein